MINDLDSLRNLAANFGIATEYWTYDGTLVQVDAQTLQTVLASFDVVVNDDADVYAALVEKEDSIWRKRLPGSVIAREDRDYWLFVHVPDGTQVKVSVRFADGNSRDLEQLDNYVPPREVDGALIGRATFLIPAGLPIGWHEVSAQVADEPECVVPLAITPGHIPNDGKRRWGIAAQMYSVTGESSWGIGDFGDLADLGTWAAEQNADFILINPLHAAEPVPPLTPSPYLPASRRFLNPIYIRPTDIPEYSRLDEWEMNAARMAFQEANTAGELINRDLAWEDKFIVLEKIFFAGRSAARQRIFEKFVAEQGAELENFALWCALKEAGQGEIDPQYADVNSPAVAQARIDLKDRCDFYCWLQWIATQQLETTQKEIRECGMNIGIMHDLAVGVHWKSADVWANPHLFGSTVTVGAPPDMYNALGQNWSQPPMRPDVLEEVAYKPVRDMVRATVRGGGALRIDHVMGLFRLWWIPKGADPRTGTYVRYNHEAMVGVVALEAALAGALIVGEDLGTVEPWVRGYLQERGLYGTAVTWFEGGENGYLKDPSEYRWNQLATVNTHDLAPSLAYLQGSFFAEMEKLNLLDHPEAVIAQHHEQMAKLKEQLQFSGELSPADADDPKEVLRALHRWVAKGNAQYFAVALVDMVLDRTRQNIPGTDEEYPNWQQWLRNSKGKRMTVSDVASSKFARQLLADVDRKFHSGS